MINLHYLFDFKLDNESMYLDWIKRIILSENQRYGKLDFIFCDDAYLLKINQDFLNHDTYTDIITFPYHDGLLITADIFISIERVIDNATIFDVDFFTELKRVMAHGILHLLGYGDKLEEEILLMRLKEDEKIKLFHVEH